MNKELLFSIIVPTYNRASFIQNTIDSVLAQTYPHFELIIVDDGSTDNSYTIINNYSSNKIHYIKKENEERGKARNTGIDLSKGDYVTFLDSDDVIYPNHLEHAARMIQAKNLPDFYRQAYEIRDEKGHLLVQKNKIEGDANELILKGNYFSCIGIFLKQEVAKNVQFRNDRFLSPSEDWDYWLRLSVRYKITYDNTITSCMLEHKGRSVHHFNVRLNKLVIARFVKSLQNDAVFMQKRGNLLNGIKAQMYTLYCLNKVVAGHNKDVLKLLLSSYRMSFQEVFKRRTIAILKYYLLNLIN